MITKFKMIRDIAGYNGFGLTFTEWNYNIVLASGSTKTLTIPEEDERYIAIFSFEPGSTVYVANNDTAAIPGASFAKSSSQLNPVGRWVKAGDVLSFITSNTNADICVQLYAL
jgi:hypothetical protein